MQFDKKLEDHEVAIEAVEAAWADEINKRLNEIDSGAVRTIPWPEARKRIWAAAQGHRRKCSDTA